MPRCKEDDFQEIMLFHYSKKWQRRSTRTPAPMVMQFTNLVNPVLCHHHHIPSSLSDICPGIEKMILKENIFNPELSPLRVGVMKYIIS